MFIQYFIFYDLLSSNIPLKGTHHLMVCFPHKYLFKKRFFEKILIFFEKNIKMKEIFHLIIKKIYLTMQKESSLRTLFFASFKKGVKSMQQRFAHWISVLIGVNIASIFMIPNELSNFFLIGLILCMALNATLLFYNLWKIQSIHFPLKLNLFNQLFNLGLLLTLLLRSIQNPNDQADELLFLIGSIFCFLAFMINLRLFFKR